MARADITMPRRGAAAWLAPGESGAISVITGLIVIGIIFQSLNGHFLSPVNLTDLLIQGAVFMLLGMSEVFALLLGDIDLSIGFVSGIGGVITAELLIGSRDWPWWAAVIAALLVTTAIGAAAGHPDRPAPAALVRGDPGRPAGLPGGDDLDPRLGRDPADLRQRHQRPGQRLPHAGRQLAAHGGHRRRVRGRHHPARRRAPDRRDRAAGQPDRRQGRCRGRGGLAIVAVCDTNRGVLSPVRGVPWVVLIVLGVLFAWSFLLNRTRFGRDVHAIGSNAEAARRAGVSLARIRTVSFALAGLTAGVGGIIYASELRSVSSGTDGATLVLYAVAAAVIGGTSLFGGRGKPLDGVLGGIVIAAIYNGIYLLGMSAAAQDLIFALVLLAAVSADVLARRGQASRRA